MAKTAIDYGRDLMNTWDRSVTAGMVRRWGKDETARRLGEQFLERHPELNIPAAADALKASSPEFHEEVEEVAEEGYTSWPRPAPLFDYGEDIDLQAALEAIETDPTDQGAQYDALREYGLGTIGNLPTSILTEASALGEAAHNIGHVYSGVKTLGAGIYSNYEEAFFRGLSEGGKQNWPLENQIVDDMYDAVSQWFGSGSALEDAARFGYENPAAMLNPFRAARPLVNVKRRLSRMANFPGWDESVPLPPVSDITGVSGQKYSQLGGFAGHPVDIPGSILNRMRQSSEGFPINLAVAPAAAMTGAPQAALREAIGSGVAKSAVGVGEPPLSRYDLLDPLQRVGARRANLFKEGIKSRGALDRGKNLLDRFSGAFKILSKRKSARYEEALNGLEVVANLDVGMTNIRKALRELLEKEGIGFAQVGGKHGPAYKAFTRENTPIGTPHSPVPHNDVTGKIRYNDRSFVHDINLPEDRELLRNMTTDIENWDWTSVAGMQKLKQNMYKYSGQTNNKSPAQQMAQQMYHEVDNVMRTSIEGYGSMSDEYRTYSDLLRQIKTTISLPTTSKDFEKSLSGTIGRLDRLMSDNSEYARWVVSQMEEITGQQFIPLVSGMSLSPVLPAGITGRAGMQRGVRAALMPIASAVGVGAATSTINPIFALALPFFSPIVSGTFYHAMGKAVGLPVQKVKRLSKNMAELNKKVAEKYPEIASTTHSLGQVLSAVAPSDAVLYNYLLWKAINIGDDEAPSAMPIEEVPDVLGKYGSDVYKAVKNYQTPVGRALELDPNWTPLDKASEAISDFTQGIDTSPRRIPPPPP